MSGNLPPSGNPENQGQASEPTAQPQKKPISKKTRNIITFAILGVFGVLIALFFDKIPNPWANAIFALIFAVIAAIIIEFLFPDSVVEGFEIEWLKSLNMAMGRASGHFLIFVLFFLVVFSASSFPEIIRASTNGPPTEPIEEMTEATIREQEILAVREGFTRLHANWQNVDEGERYCRLARNSSQASIKSLEDIPDNVFREEEDKLHAVIEKYRSLQYLYVIASDVECDVRKAQEYARKAIADGTQNLDNIEETRSVEGEYGRQLREWIRSESMEGWTHVYLALANALLYRNGDSYAFQATKDALEHDSVLDSFFDDDRFALNDNKILGPVLQRNSTDDDGPPLRSPCDCG